MLHVGCLGNRSRAERSILIRVRHRLRICCYLRGGTHLQLRLLLLVIDKRRGVSLLSACEKCLLRLRVIRRHEVFDQLVALAFHHFCGLLSYRLVSGGHTRYLLRATIVNPGLLLHQILLFLVIHDGEL